MKIYIASLFALLSIGCAKPLVETSAKVCPAPTQTEEVSPPQTQATSTKQPRNSDGSLKKLPPGPPAAPPYTLVLAYDDFGPQALSFGLIGMSWWQWSGGGSWELGDSFDVRVVVYRNKTLSEIKAKYPTIEDVADYRYVSYEDALAFFQDAFADEAVEGALRDELQETKKKIITNLGAP